MSRRLGLSTGRIRDSVRISARGPGLYTITIQTRQLRLAAALDSAGVEVKSLEVAF